ncbi:Arm DNA-binding domain-containing protein [Enterococcus faecium]|nr:Arm DNA-binding domain-containing protein [Enterococcus faecium]
MTGKPDKVRRRGFKTKKEAQLALSHACKWTTIKTVLKSEQRNV